MAKDSKLEAGIRTHAKFRWVGRYWVLPKRTLSMVRYWVFTQYPCLISVGIGCFLGIGYLHSLVLIPTYKSCGFTRPPK